MDTREMTKEQLIAQIDALKAQIGDFEAAEVRYKKLEDTLRVTDEKFSFFFNTAPIGLIVASAQGDILNANKTAHDLIGYGMEEPMTMNIVEFYADPDDRKRLLELLFKTNNVSDFETRIKHKNGKLLTVLINANYIDLDNTKVLLTSIHDITQFKKVQKELRASEDEYRILFNHAPIGITVTDIQGNLIANNKAIQDLLDYSAEDIKTISVQDYYYDTDERQQLINMTKRYGIVRDFETKLISKDGNTVSVLINSDLIDYKDKSKVLLTSIRDITNIKHVEDELTSERDFTNAILDTAASLMLLLNRNGVIVKFNQACEKTTGYSFKELEGQHIWDKLSDNPAATKEMFEKLMAGDYPNTFENNWLTKAGLSRLISWTYTALLDYVGKVEYIIATGIDITEQRQAEIGLKEANQNLVLWNKELEERTTELSQLSEMGEQLQNCQTIEEAYALSAQYIQKICPVSQGALYLINSSKDLVDAVEMWGDNASTDKTFLPIDCWAIRRGRPHMVDNSLPGLHCGHVSGSPDNRYLCVPMMANGEIMGIIHLNQAPSDEKQESSADKSYNEHKIQLVVTMAEHIALALSNINLRETLRQQSIRDILTGLFNRRFMEESLERELRRAARAKTLVGIIMIDIDHFKAFNDISGHDGGDTMLRELGTFLNKNTRGSDIVCRYGGEEFVAVLPGATLEETRFRAEELRKGVKQMTVLHLGKLLEKCTISLGVSAFPEHGLTSEELLKKADNALYQAKSEGRDRVVAAPAVDNK